MADPVSLIASVLSTLGASDKSAGCTVKHKQDTHLAGAVSYNSSPSRHDLLVSTRNVKVPTSALG
jgi:hypothetical protein